MWKCDYRSQHLVKVNDLQLKETAGEQQKKVERKGVSVGAATHKPSVNVENCGKPTTSTREGERERERERGEGWTNNTSMKEMKEKGWIQTKGSVRGNVK